jgi:hypothetical protein
MMALRSYDDDPKSQYMLKIYGCRALPRPYEERKRTCLRVASLLFLTPHFHGLTLARCGWPVLTRDCSDSHDIRNPPFEGSDQQDQVICSALSTIIIYLERKYSMWNKIFPFR